MYHRSWSCKGSKMKDYDHVYGIWNMGVLRGSWIVFNTLIVSSIRCSLRCAQLDQFAKLLHHTERWRLQLPWRRVRQCWSSVKRSNYVIIFFLALQTQSEDSSICDNVTHWGSQFWFWNTQRDPRHLWPLKHLIRVMRKPDQQNDNNKDNDNDKYI